MIELIKTCLALKSDRRAVTALEYGLIAGVIVATVSAGFTAFGGALLAKFTAITTGLS